MTNFKSLYDDLYNNGYHANLGYTHSKPLIKIIYNTIPEGSRVIDVGCSNGTAGLILNKKYVCSGIDISEVAINLAKKNGFYDCKVCPTHNIDYPNSYFDAILCTDVLEHVNSEEIVKTFQEFERITKNYYFLIIALKKEFHKGFVEIKRKHSIKNLHILVKNKKYWEDLFDEGRSEKFYKEDDINSLGWNMYMTPVEAAMGLSLLQNYPENVSDDQEINGYRDLTEFTIFKDSKLIE